MLRPAILRAVIGLFSQRGFEQPTMDEVATAAGVSKATLYSYFGGKSALIDAVIDELLRELPAPRSPDRTLPLRQQFIDVGLQLHRLAAHPAAVLLAVRLGEQLLSAQQLAEWRKPRQALEDVIARLLERQCDCEYPRQVAQLFILLVAGDLRPGSASLQIVDRPRIDSAVDLILRAYPQGCG